MIRKMTIALWLFLIPAVVVSQDPQFSQYYSNPLELNPAFTGSTDQYRFVANYRNQWPELPRSFVTYNASFDAFLSDIRSGLGLKLTHDRAGSGALSYTNASGLFAYLFRIHRDIYVKPGMQFGVYQRAVDQDRLKFGDQLIRGGNRSSFERFPADKKTYFDFSSGIIIYSANLFLGFSAHHLNEPNESLLGENASLPTRYSLHGGGRLVLRQNHRDEVMRAIRGTFQLRKQNESTQLDLGAYVEFNPIVFGAWYRGIDWSGSTDRYYENRDAIIATVGVMLPQVRIGYSYDITISQLFGNTGGAHEIAFVAEFVNPKPKKRVWRIVPCPKF